MFRGFYEAALSEFDHVPDVDCDSIDTLRKLNRRTSFSKIDFLISKRLSCPRGDETSGRDDYRNDQSSLKPFDSRSSLAPETEGGRDGGRQEGISIVTGAIWFL